MSSPTSVEDAPSYLSSHMADVVLSEFRPTRIKPEALLCVNVLLDELLWSILQSARSLSTERLKSDGILRVIPASLGKEAILEAELELREYWKNSGEARDSTRDVKEHAASFPVQAVFEILRLKCEANSSLGGGEEEDAMAVAKAQDHLYKVGGTPPPIESIAPASLYLTAILEHVHVCGHIMSCMSRVVARDSSKTSASIQDLYNALCEDPSLYSMSKTMKAFSSIEGQARTNRIQRKGSLSLGKRTNTASPRPGTGNDQHSAESPTSVTAPSLTSAESPVPGGPPAASLQAPGRSSLDKIKGARSGIKASLTSKPSSDSVSRPGSAQTETSGPHKRSNSVMSDATKRAMVAFQGDDSMTPVDDGEESEFEELMRAGATMKVSLTPDRLRTFEVFAKERNQRGGNRATPPVQATTPEMSSQTSTTRLPAVPPVPPLPTSVSLPAVGAAPVKRATNGPSAIPDGYATDTNTSRPVQRSVPIAKPRPEMVQQMSSESAGETPPSSWARARASTESRVVPPKTLTAASRKGSMPGLITSVLEDDSDDNEGTPKSKPPLSPRAPRVSQSARDLISFLDEGPPEELLPAVTRSGSTISFDASSKKSKGSLMSMVSRFGKSAPGAEINGVSRNGPVNSPRRQRSAYNMGAAISSQTPIPLPPSPVRPIPPRIPLHEKDSIPYLLGTANEGRKNSITRKAPPAVQDVGAKTQNVDIVKSPGAIPPTPPSSATDSRRAGSQGLIQKPHSVTFGDGSASADVDPNKAQPSRIRAPMLPSSAVAGQDYVQPAGLSPGENGGGDPRITPSPAGDQQIPTGQSSIDASLLVLQKLVKNAGNLEECKLLVDGLLAQRGLEVERTSSGTALPRPNELQQSEDDQQTSVIQWLLTGDSGRGLMAANDTLALPDHENGLGGNRNPSPRLENGYHRMRSKERKEGRRVQAAA